MILYGIIQDDLSGSVFLVKKLMTTLDKTNNLIDDAENEEHCPETDQPGKERNNTC